MPTLKYEKKYDKTLLSEVFCKETSDANDEEKRLGPVTDAPVELPQWNCAPSEHYKQPGANEISERVD